MAENTFPIKGACQCGNVTYELHEAPQQVFACHCKECQKLSTSPFSVTAMVPHGAITFNGEMKDWSRVAESGNRNFAKFCACCGNRVYHYNPDAPDILKLKLKPVDVEDDSIFAPSVHIWICEKQDWYEIPEGMETRDKQ
ncbi:MAG: GFA family protein [Agarilytica sp.]